MKARRFQESDSRRWDEFVGTSPTATFLQSRKFLSYHADRFEDYSLLLEDADGRLLAILPAAAADDAKSVSSHPGATYGGLAISSRAARDVPEMIDVVIRWYRERSFESLIYKSIPTPLQSLPSMADQHELWRQNACLFRRDLWNVITLNNDRNLSHGRKWGLKRAARQGLVVAEESTPRAYQMFYEILSQRLLEKYGSTPAHSVGDMRLLNSLFPEQITLYTVADETGALHAGTWIFKFGRQAWHTQYIAATEQGRERCATELLLESVIRLAEDNKIAYFSFGASTEQDGRLLNSGLFKFKMGFGSGSILHDIYRIDL